MFWLIMGKSNPLFSVCIPTYNRARSLATAVESVLTQDVDDYELLVVDNNSSDDTAEVMAGFTNRQVRYVRNPENIGMVANWNRCVELARGRYFAMLHDDDLYEVEFLSQMARLLADSSPDTVGGYCGALLVDKDNRPIRLLREPLRTRWIKDPIEQTCHHIKAYPPTVTHVIRLDVLREVPPPLFQERYYPIMDFVGFLRATMGRRLSVLPKPLVRWRLHKGRASVTAPWCVGLGNFIIDLRAGRFNWPERVASCLNEELPKRALSFQITSLARQSWQRACDDLELLHEVALSGQCLTSRLACAFLQSRRTWRITWLAMHFLRRIYKCVGS
jgi:glycosyltransferase involved in cell wall biosynthesis